MTQLTQEELVIRGEAALRILNDASLMGFFEEMRQDRLTCIALTEPQDSTTRESLYYQHKGLVDLVDLLESYKLAAQQIVDSEAPLLALDDDDEDSGTD